MLKKRFYLELKETRCQIYINFLWDCITRKSNNMMFPKITKHHIFALPCDAIPKEININLAPRFFEFQIKTLFQHAWSEANHDLGYKPESGALTGEQKRKLAFTSAQA